MFTTKISSAKESSSHDITMNIHFANALRIIKHYIYNDEANTIESILLFYSSKIDVIIK